MKYSYRTYDGRKEEPPYECPNCVEKDAELTEATDACNGLHDMVKDLEKENVRLSAIVARVEDVEKMAKEIDVTANANTGSVSLYDHECEDIARAVRDYLMREGK